jgi:hypothetical protein
MMGSELALIAIEPIRVGSKCIKSHDPVTCKAVPGKQQWPTKQQI